MEFSESKWKSVLFGSQADERDASSKYSDHSRALYSGLTNQKQIKWLGFPRSHHIEVDGFSGGIWLLWKEASVQVEVVFNKKQFMHTKVLVNRRSMLLTTVYGRPKASNYSKLWKDIRTLASTIKDLWVLIGNFNAMLSSDEKKEGSSLLAGKCKEFVDCVNNSELIDMDFIGHQFTWKKRYYSRAY